MPLCECGRPRGRRNVCEHCVFLDGQGVGETDVIHAMRGRGYMTVSEITDVSKREYSQVCHILRRLTNRGRVVRKINKELSDRFGNHSKFYCLTV